MKHIITTGYGWIRPTGECLQVQDPTQLTPAILADCKGIMQLFNVTTERDDSFYLNLFNYAYRRGYLRISKHQRVLGVESYSYQHIDAHVDLLNRIADGIRYKGVPLSIKRFATDHMTHPTQHTQRNSIFPRM